MTNNPNIAIELNNNAVQSNLYMELKNGNSDSPSRVTLSKIAADYFP